MIKKVAFMALVAAGILFVYNKSPKVRSALGGQA